jgi:hypothetical protein
LGKIKDLMPEQEAHMEILIYEYLRDFLLEKLEVD